MTCGWDFHGRTVLVTGAASGMGRATALAFAEAGANVAVADVAVTGGRETVKTIERAGGQARFFPADVSDTADVANMIDATVTAFGRLDSAVNGAGIEIETTPLAECDEETFDRLVRVNLRSVFLCLKHEIRQMIAQEGGGTIVNIASVNSFRPQPHQAAYTATKHGVLGLTRTAAVEYAPAGIRINAVCPGAIATPMLENAMKARGRDPADVAGRLSLLGRFGQPSEIANAVLWLCSDESSFTMGHALAVDGGYLAR
ncbi:glucose 1-dehydrogenase [Frankia sp. Cppng1_Ct_nod]|uniref:glucose 1-dehydrogenase n=1 Tax=Frankia sp. Cppng1_Ct_nod TaxID=2897162 RepID=UPI001A93EE88|nr:glucose 1-dehydrogenase [Frankia sp. Cppng1_Ct_nod]